MRAVIQRSAHASVTVDSKIVGKISDGLVILLGITQNDTAEDAQYIADKIVNLRIFPDQEKEFDKSLLEVKKEALIISQFTLYASTKKGRRPDFNQAAKPEISEPLYEKFCEYIKNYGIKVSTGIFGAMMDVELINHGPVTITIESHEK